MRILQVSTLYPPELNSGGTLACHELAVALNRRGHQVSVFAGSARDDQAPMAEARFVHEGIPVVTCNVRSGYAGVLQNYRNASVAARFARVLDEERPDIVHFHSIQALGADLLGVAREHGAACLVTMHDLWFACAQQFVTTPAPELRRCPLVVEPAHCDCIAGFDFVERRRYLSAALRSADRIVAVSEFLAGVLQRNGLGRDRITVVENGLPTPAPLPKTASDRTRFAYLGGAHPWKGAGTLAAALRLVERELEVDLYGVDADAWSRLGARWPDPRVRCLPPFTPRSIAKVMSGADAVLLPSLCVESFSLVTREALLHGVPVIASRCGGPEEIVRDGQNGLLFDRGDAPGLARAITRFADDPDLRRRLAANAAEATIPTTDMQAARLEELYRDLLPGSAAAVTSDLPSSVLLLGGADGAPFRYRVTHLEQQLRHLGVRATARFVRDEEALDLAARHEIVILYRVPWDGYVERIVERARAAGALLVFSVDDLVFDPEAVIPAVLDFKPADRKRYWGGVRRMLRTAQACDAFLASTGPLAEAASLILRKPTFVHENALSPRLLDLSRQAVEAAAAKRGAREPALRLGYFSGTDTHDRDLALIAAPLARFLERRPEAMLVLGGRVSIPPALARHSSRIERVAFLPWHLLPERLASLAINLVPIETGFPFNEAKSALKFLEASAASVTTIASPTRPLREVIRHGVNGLLAASESEWAEALEQLSEDPARRDRLARAAREDVLALHSFDAATRSLQALLPQLAALRPSPSLRPLPPVSQSQLASLRAQVGLGRPALEPEDAIPGPCELEGRAFTRAIDRDNVAVQPFFCPEGLLYRVDLKLATYGSSPPAEVTLQVFDVESGQELRRSRVDGATICDDAWRAFEFQPLETTPGRELCAVIASPDAPSGSGPSAYCVEREWPNGRASCGGETGFDLTFRTWLRPRGWLVPGVAEALEEQARRLDALESRLSRTALGTRTERPLFAHATGPRRVRSNRGPSLPYLTLRKVYHLIRPGADEADTDRFVAELRSTAAYRMARSVYHRLRGRQG